jgi:hypothetical protein
MKFLLTNTSYYQLLYAFESTSGSISDLYNMINSVASDCADPTLLGNFIENHDNPRFASYVLPKSISSFATDMTFQLHERLFPSEECYFIHLLL